MRLLLPERRPDHSVRTCGKEVCDGIKREHGSLRAGNPRRLRVEGALQALRPQGHWLEGARLRRLRQRRPERLQHREVRLSDPSRGLQHEGPLKGARPARRGDLLAHEAHVRRAPHHVLQELRPPDHRLRPLLLGRQAHRRGNAGVQGPARRLVPEQGRHLHGLRDRGLLRLLQRQPHAGARQPSRQHHEAVVERPACRLGPHLPHPTRHPRERHRSLGRPRGRLPRVLLHGRADGEARRVAEPRRPHRPQDHLGPQQEAPDGRRLRLRRPRRHLRP